MERNRLPRTKRGTPTKIARGQRHWHTDGDAAAHSASDSSIARRTSSSSAASSMERFIASWSIASSSPPGCHCRGAWGALLGPGGQWCPLVCSGDGQLRATDSGKRVSSSSREWCARSPPKQRRHRRKNRWPLRAQSSSPELNPSASMECPRGLGRGLWDTQWLSHRQQCQTKLKWIGIKGLDNSSSRCEDGERGRGSF